MHKPKVYSYIYSYTNFHLLSHIIGSRVEEFCTVPHTSAICKDCIDGENYTEHANGLEHCLPCIDCKPGTVHFGHFPNCATFQHQIL